MLSGLLRGKAASYNRAMQWPRHSDLEEPARSIVAGALGVVQGLVSAGADEATIRVAVKSAQDVFDTVVGEYDPARAISDYLHLEASLFLS